jgi:energy-coupling factor transporter ATP-binding protein EcfA2
MIDKNLPKQGKRNPIFPKNFSPFFPSDKEAIVMLTSSGNLYLSKAELINVQGFENLTIRFTGKDNQVLMYSLFLGNNSAGKTSFLRCLALGMCDETGASGLIEELQSPFIRQGEKEAVISIELIASNGRYRIVTKVKRINTSERIRQHYYSLSEAGAIIEIQPEDFPWDNLFVCGYGAGRILGEITKTYEKYRVPDAIGTLFRYDQPMQHPELSLHRLVMATRKQVGEHAVEQQILQRFLALIGELFMLTAQDRIELTEKGIQIINAEKAFPLLASGDGYKNTAAWVLDMVTWKILAARSLEPTEMSGIVLLDEVEQHLHPNWQRHLVRLMRQQFPKIQWIATTHSPISAAGTADLPDDEYQLLRFDREPQSFIQLVEVPSLRGLKADQVLTSTAFL